MLGSKKHKLKAKYDLFALKMWLFEPLPNPFTAQVRKVTFFFSAGFFHSRCYSAKQCSYVMLKFVAVVVVVVAVVVVILLNKLFLVNSL